MSLLLRTVAVLMTLLPLACSAADEPKYRLGQHYVAARVAQKTADPKKIEVMEVFAYSCPHCFQFEQPLKEWLKKKPADVAFVRMPHTLGQPANVVRNKAFYAAEMLGVFEPFHKALFAAIHGQGKLMSSEADVRALFLEHTGVKAEDFDGAFKSFAVDSRQRIAENALREMGIPSVPTMVVEGKYYSTPRSGGFGEMLAITDFLVAEARKERQSR